MSLASFGILLEVAPDEQEKAQVEQNIQVSIANGALRLEDAIMVRGIKNTKMANQMLILRREKYKKEKMEEQQSLMEQNAKVQQQSAQQAAQLKQQELQVTMQTKQMEIQAKTQAEAELKKVEYDLKEQFESSQHQRRLEEIYAQNEGKVGAATTNKETRKEIQDKSAKNQSHMIEQRKDRKGQIE